MDAESNRATLFPLRGIARNRWAEGIARLAKYSD